MQLITTVQNNASGSGRVVCHMYGQRDNLTKLPPETSAHSVNNDKTGNELEIHNAVFGR